MLLATLKVIADYYPSRLHKAFVIDPPSIFSYLWKVNFMKINDKIESFYIFLHVNYFFLVVILNTVTCNAGCEAIC